MELWQFKETFQSAYTQNTSNDYKTPEKKSEQKSEPNVNNQQREESKIVERVREQIDESTSQNSSPKKILFDKFAAQNLNVMETVMLSGETTKVMVFKRSNLCDTVKVVPIAQDGNCLFRAAAHQLYRIETGSKDHDKLTADLRSKVVKHMLENLPRFERVIRLRLEDENHCAVDAGACEKFISDYIAKPGNWDGSESMMAIGELYSANIVIFKENELYYFATGFNETYDQVLFLAYRNRNHYDSVCEISENVLYNCSCDLIDSANSNHRRVISV